jgi:hypothetical protein
VKIKGDGKRRRSSEVEWKVKHRPDVNLTGKPTKKGKSNELVMFADLEQTHKRTKSILSTHRGLRLDKLETSRVCWRRAGAKKDKVMFDVKLFDVYLTVSNQRSRNEPTHLFEMESHLPNDQS